MIIEKPSDVTEAVLGAVDRTPDARTKEILSSLVRHLHGFIREVKLTEREFQDAIGLVNSIGQRLQESAPDPAFKLFPYSFRVVDSPEVNAFALPGGPIYINSALIELCDTEDQLASVIGHEMGHVAARHATEMLTTQNLTQLALIAAVSVIPVPVPPIAWEGTKLGYVLGLLRYSRGKEAEADHLGLELMNAAGYDPNEMAVVFGRLAEQQHSLPSVVERFFSSHPLSENRMRDAERRAAALPRPPNAPVATARSSTFSEVNLMFAKD